MNFDASQDQQLFVHTTQFHNGLPVIIVDDYYILVAQGECVDADAKFIDHLVKELSRSFAVRKVVLTGFDVKPEWLSDYIQEGAILFIDMLNTEGAICGPAVIQALKQAGASDAQIVVFTKAPDNQLVELLGEGFKYQVMSKAIDPSGNILGQSLWKLAIESYVRFVESRHQTYYSDAARTWNEIRNKLSHWSDSGPLFESGRPEHDASFWIINPTLQNVQSQFASGVTWLQKLTGSQIPFSPTATFCGLKGITYGRISARFLCEVFGIAPAILDNSDIKFQLLAEKQNALLAQTLAGLSFLTQTSTGTKWHFEISDISTTKLSFSGLTVFGSENLASEAALELSKTPTQRMNENPGRIGPGDAVSAVHMIRSLAQTIEFHTEGTALKCSIAFGLRGQLT